MNKAEKTELVKGYVGNDYTPEQWNWAWASIDEEECMIDSELYQTLETESIEDMSSYYYEY